MKSNKRSGMRTRLLLTVVALVMAGCLGGGDSGSGNPVVSGGPSPPTGQNVLPVSVDAGPANTVNVPFVSVTICAPATSNCQTIDHVMLDTGSSGLRVISSVLSPSLALTQSTVNGNPLAECLQFSDGYIWGPVKIADVKLGSASIHSMAIHVIGAPGFMHIPGSCSNSGPPENTVKTFGGNGILGAGVFQQDCGFACAHVAIPGTYYACGASCQSIAVDLARQVQNPVGLLGNDNNGVVIDLPAVAAGGAATIGGSLILGIGTQANNSLGNAVVYAVDANSGTLTTMLNGKSYAGSFIDSGSNGLFFPDGNIAVCASGFYCPPFTQQFTATNLGTNGSSGSVNFSVANADSLFNSGNTAFNNLAGPTFGASSFDWGLSFFYGRRVFTAIEGKSSAGGNGPYIAY